MILKTSKKGVLLTLFFIATLFMGGFALAQGTTITNTKGPTITNPIGSKSFIDLFNNLASAIRVIAIPFAVVMIIYVGFKFVFAASTGNESELEKAKKLMGYLIIGIIIITAGSLLVNAIADFVKQL